MDSSQYIDMFVEEAREQIQNLERSLLALEKGGFNEGEMNTAYRIVHTLKGNANLIGITTIGETAHAMEDLFDLLREKKEVMDKEMFNVLLEAMDCISWMVNELATTRSVKTDSKQIVTSLHEMKNGLTKKGAAKKKIAIEIDIDITNEIRKKMARLSADGLKILAITLDFKEKTPFKAGRFFQVTKKLSLSGNVLATAPDPKGMDDDADSAKILYATSESEVTLTKSILEITGIQEVRFESIEEAKKQSLQEKILKDLSGESKPTEIEKIDTVRIRSRLLDELLDLVGELMINNIRINQIGEEMKHKDLKQVLKQSARLIGDFQDVVLGMRMVPIDLIFQRFPRMVRDLARAKNKKVNLVLVGNDIVVDRSLLDNIGDSLVHALRNSIDHGIEPPEEREKVGKNPTGMIKVSAMVEHTNVVITIEDDGTGFDAEKLLERAIVKGIITPESAKNWNEMQIISLAFQSGVSTAAKITDTSGRGVGLDVIKSKIESHGGSVKLESKKGVGSKLTIRLPPTMSIIKAMMLKINEESYAIPLDNIRETIKISSKDVYNIGKQAVFRLRDEVLPLVDMHVLFGGERLPIDRLPILVVEKDEKHAALIVTSVIGQEEIVVKNIGKDLIKTDIFSGATILGNGRVALIIDVGALI